nr:PREDICTED: uncharacterized protein LOC107397621 [Tribolium castaneum]|eukprot:XP_015833888.1 PREDICTED: uncharacterized protein LOC107397621 [Tribolium castaneum]
MDRESIGKDAQLPLTQSKYVLAKYGIQVIDPQHDPLEETFLATGSVTDDMHYHPGPRAIECKADAGKFGCDRDSCMRVLWCYLFPCALLESCLVALCDCWWECFSGCLRRMEEHYTFQCCERCCKLQEN